ncbi:acyl-homoserine-lactone synthase [Sphingomonas profundi]|uniref:acyl-homoserine-lactone synthase n=1 Tax=Alterirhizorhabdus profundi TaxID=2681549 RepID=UPI0018D0D61B|nr:acyl-homoserine-lactone synthase [Sphingomonas profundi]
MIDTIYPDDRHAYATPLIQMYHDRKRVFVDHLGWRLKSPGSWLEVDDYDNEHAVYLMARDGADGSHIGSVRLLPTTGAHLMDGVFPDLCAEGLLRGADIWEISRLVATVQGRAGTRLLRVHRMLALALVEFARLNDITGYVLVAESQRVPALLSVGWRVTPLSLPTEHEGETIEALRIHIEADTLARMRARLGFDGPVLSVSADDVARAA